MRESLYSRICLSTRIYFIVSALLLICPSCQSSEMTTAARHMRHFCSGSANGRSKTGSHNSVEDLRLIYQNCTRVFGNIELTHIEVNKGDELDFFDDIEEVKGYVFIYVTNNLTRVSFKNLSIIWGDQLLDGYALQINQAPLLEVVSMPNLKTVHNGKVGVTLSRKLCYVKDKVNFLELLDFDKDRLTFKNFTNFCDNHPVKCNSTCDGHCWGPTANDCQSIYRTNCPDQCDSKMCYLDAASNPRCCDSQCVAGCSGPTAMDCYACQHFVQCEGSTHNHCKCVDQCTARTKYDAKKGMVVPNPAGYYQHDRYCEKQCPEERLIQNDICVEHCSDGYYYDVRKGDRQCVKCDGECPKVCKFEKELNSFTIKELVNCTEIEGYVKLQSHAMLQILDSNAKKEPETFLYPDPDTGKDIWVKPMFPKDLEVLRSVRIVTAYVYIATSHSNLTSLDFLQNLEIIEGRSLLNSKQSLVVSSNYNLMELGLRSLREIKKGEVIISRNMELCYADSIDWTELGVEKNKTTVKENRIPKDCKAKNKVCHSACEQAKGCWGPSNGHCRRCSKFTQNGRCVDACTKKGFFADTKSWKCLRCYGECNTCKGPAASDCLSCRNLKLYVHDRPRTREGGEEEKEGEVKETKAVDPDGLPRPALLEFENYDDDDYESDPETSSLVPGAHVHREKKKRLLRCFAQCPTKAFYEEDNECKRCHRSCYENGCTGPSNRLGPGGCNNCTFAQIEVVNGTEEVSRCLFNRPGSHGKDVCISNDLLDHYVAVAQGRKGVIDHECRPCDTECSQCKLSGNSRSKSACVCKHFVIKWFMWQNPDETDELCMMNCPSDAYLVKEQDNGGNGECERCDFACERQLEGGGPVCTGPGPGKCTKCSLRTFEYGEGDDRKCVEECPDEAPFVYSVERKCYDVDRDNIDLIKKIVFSLAIFLLVLILSIIGLVVYFRARKLKKELDQEKVANAPDLPQLIPMDMTSVRPNMERLNLLPQDQLTRTSKELGAGAFGVVYAGIWMPPKEKNMKIRVAIKVVKDPSGKAQSEVVEEATKMAMMRHEHLLRIVGVCINKDELQLVTFYRPLGNLLKFMQKHRENLGAKELLLYSYQIASGMKYLADQRVVHRDLAARNILVKSRSHVEITDFGLARSMDVGMDSIQVGEGKVALKWLAPEALERQIYNTATDVWAFGVTVWEILTFGESPYQGMSWHVIKDYIDGGHRLAQPHNCSSELYQRLLQCWLPKPDSRPSFRVLKDSFYSFCRAPALFVTSTYDASTPTSSMGDGPGLDIFDNTDFLENPDDYFDNIPNSPGILGHATNDSFNGIRRLDSVTSSNSTRYASDPTRDHNKEVGMDDGNYLVPNSKAVVKDDVSYYLPVVNQQGDTELVDSREYYNEVRPDAEYVNDTATSLAKKALLPSAAAIKKREVSQDERKPVLSIIEEDYSTEKESCL